MLSIIGAFNFVTGRVAGRAPEAVPLGQSYVEPTICATHQESTGDKKFVGGRRTHENMTPPSLDEGVKIPNTLRHACQILGLSLDERITETMVNQAWKKQMLVSNAHPDLGGNAEEAVLINTAKIEIMAFLESCKPKLGAHFKKD